MLTRIPAFAAALLLTLVPIAPSLAEDARPPAAHHHAAAITVGTLEIENPFTRATLPNAPVGGGFLTITNKGSEDDRLVSVSTDIAKESQIHEMAMSGDVMKMRQLADGLVVPAGETVVLEPGGFHLMFMGLSAAIAEGEAVPVTLVFEKAGSVTVDFVAAGSAATAPAMSHTH